MKKERETSRLALWLMKALNLYTNIFKKPTPPRLALFIGEPQRLFRTPTLFPFLFKKRDSAITKKTIRLIEKESIRAFVADQRSYLRGRVLDFGAGKEPYKELVDGEYVPYEKGEQFPSGVFDAVLVNQVAQYLPDPIATFSQLARVSGHLVMTYPTNWEEVEDVDLWRFTKMGMERILRESGFTIITHEPRCAMVFEDFQMVIGYGVVAKSNHR